MKIEQNESVTQNEVIEIEPYVRNGEKIPKFKKFKIRLRAVFKLCMADRCETA